MRTTVVAAALALALLAVVILGQSPVGDQFRVPIWDSAAWHYTWPALGSSLSLASGKLEVVPAPVLKRVYGECLVYDPATTSWGTVPAGAANLSIFLNGLRHAPKDFTLSTGRLTPLSPWKPGAGCLIVDYDLP